VAAAACVGLVLSGCSWRIETAPEPIRTPSASVRLRDEVARTEAGVIMATGVQPTGPLAAAEAADAPVRLAALGGVSPAWTPVPSLARSTPAVAPGVRESVVAARDAALTCALSTDDPTLAALCASIAVSHAATLFAAGLASGDTALPDVVNRPIVTANPALTPPVGASVTADERSRLALEHDRARYLYEVAAARESGDRRDRALARAGLHRARADALLAVTGTTDLREATYAVGVAEVAGAENRDAAERGVEAALAANYAALLVTATAGDRPWLMNAAYDAYAASAALPGAIPADVPALPGLAAGAAR
jgi:hypothetical protein